MSTPTFRIARPVWPKGQTLVMSTFFAFRATVRGDGSSALLRVTGLSRYRVFADGAFVGCGPARGPIGYDRVDEWPLPGFESDGEHTLSIEVAGYNVNAFDTTDQSAFLRAEVESAVGVTVATLPTDAPAPDGVIRFTAQALPRVQKVSRYSFQRAFSEVYRLAGPGAWFAGKVFPLEETPKRPLLPRIAPLPDATPLPFRRISATGTFRRNADAAVRSDRCIDGIGPIFKGFPPDECDLIPFHEMQRLETVSIASAKEGTDSHDVHLDDGTFAVLDAGRNVSGFFRATVRCDEPTRFAVLFDETATETGDVDPVRLGCANVALWDLLLPGTYSLQTFEPYTGRYWKTLSLGAPCHVEDAAIVLFQNPLAATYRHTTGDADLDVIFEAARETFAQNAVDVFTDCPSRERAGWLCDSFFTARVSHLLTGDTRMEQLFLENFALPATFAYIPDGMLPMCYPSDHPDGVFIPNWALWFVVELGEFAERGGDPALVAKLLPRVERLFAYLRTFLNADGLLEKLPSWVFIEWSKANAYVQDVSYPSNMLWAGALSAAGRLYGRADWLAEAERVRATIRAQSFDGEWFVDNAVRRADGTLEVTRNRTETCQYYAFFFGVATPEMHPDLHRRLLEEFGPDRRRLGLHPDIAHANAFIGNYLRFEMLSAAHRTEQIRSEIKGYFLGMARTTGTLWENDTPVASCCHGFASHVAVVIARDLLR